MSNHHRGLVTGLSLSLLLAGAGVLGACGGAHGQAKSPDSAQAATPVVPASPAPPNTTANGAANGANPGAAAPHGARPSSEEDAQEDQDNAELVVSRDVVARCPKLRLVRQHVAELDPDMVWLAVLESLGECMGQGGAMSDQNIGVSGDEEHRHVVREVLGTRGVAPTRVIATPTSAQGAAECQGGADCSKRVEITVAPTQ